MYFEYYQSKKDNQWYWRLRADNHKTIADSAEGYTSERHCTDMIGKIRGSAVYATVKKIEDNDDQSEVEGGVPGGVPK